MDDAAIVERQLGRTPRAFRRVAVRCPFGRPAVDRAAAVRRRRHAVPDAVLAHVPAPRRAGLAARGRPAGSTRWTRGGRATTPTLAREPRARRTPSSASCGRSCPVGIAGASRTGSLKCLHAHAAFALARPGYELGDAHPRRGRAALAAGRLLHRSMIRDLMDVELARQQWEDGRRRVERAHARLAGVRRALAAEVDLVVAELRRRVGQTFTLERARRRLRRTRSTGRATSLHERVPRARRRPTPRTVTDAAFQAVRARRLRLHARDDRAAAILPSSPEPCVVFAAGIGLGQALDDNAPRAATRRRSCARSTRCSLAPAARTTVTVTTTSDP